MRNVLIIKIYADKRIADTQAKLITDQITIFEKAGVTYELAEIMFDDNLDSIHQRIDMVMIDDCTNVVIYTDQSYDEALFNQKHSLKFSIMSAGSAFVELSWPSSCGVTLFTENTYENKVDCTMDNGDFQDLTQISVSPSSPAPNSCLSSPCDRSEKDFSPLPLSLNLAQSQSLPESNGSSTSELSTPCSSDSSSYSARSASLNATPTRKKPYPLDRELAPFSEPRLRDRSGLFLQSTMLRLPHSVSLPESLPQVARLIGLNCRLFTEALSIDNVHPIHKDLPEIRFTDSCGSRYTRLK
jgi:hypothetical protein